MQVFTQGMQKSLIDTRPATQHPLPPQKPVAISLHHVHFSFLQLPMITFRIHAKHREQELNTQHVLIKCVHRFWATLASAESSFAPPRSGEHVWQERRLTFYSRKMCLKRKPTIHWWNMKHRIEYSWQWVTWRVRWGEKLKFFDMLKGEQWLDDIVGVTISRGLEISHYKLIQKFDESIVMETRRSQISAIPRNWQTMIASCVFVEIQEWNRKSFCKLRHGLCVSPATITSLRPIARFPCRSIDEALELASVGSYRPAIYGNTPKRPSLS